MENLINSFITTNRSSGDGYGYGSGDGSGDGYGSGSGYGYGDGLGSLNGKKIHHIDDIQSIIDVVKGNYAKGWILNSDLTLSETFVVKSNNVFAHGKTLRKAQEALSIKLFELLPIEDRIIEFKKNFDYAKKYPAKSFFDWHNKLTGSCLQGRESFCKSKGVDLDNDTYTVREFIEMTKDSYQGDIIKQLIQEG